jgi:nicotinic acid mononucleotide adenylyltransferase
VGDSFNLFSPEAHAEALITPVSRNVLGEIAAMKGALGRFASSADFATLEQNVVAALTRIEQLIIEGKIEPLARIRHSVESGHLSPVARELRIGIFPTAANPFHWAHLLGGLVAMERFLLDKVIFVIAGRDFRKPEMAAEEARHSMARKILGLFQPFFEYSSIARGTSTAGEDNLFRILGMNPAQPIHAFYIAGGDHYHRFHPVTGSPDTIQKLEEGVSARLSGRDSHWHRVSAVFLHREDAEREVATFLDVHSVGRLPVQTSSTEIRAANEDRHRWQKLYTLPYAALRSICGSSLYRVRACAELLDELHPLLGDTRSPWSVPPA